MERRRVRFVPDDGSHPNYGRVGWAYPPGTYDPESGIDDSLYWTFEPDQVDIPSDRDLFPNIAPPEDFVDVPA